MNGSTLTWAVYATIILSIVAQPQLLRANPLSPPSGSYEFRERGSARGHALYELSTDAFTGRIAMVMGAKNMTMTEVQHAHRIGECSPAKLGSADHF